MSFDIVRNGEAQKVNPPYGFKYLYTMDNYDSSDGALPYYYDLGYRFTQKYWGKGYATEASAALMDYAFNKLKIPCVYALIEADNLKSRRVLEKVGFHEDKPMTIDGVPHVQFKAIKPM